jgi:adenylate cyclase, class 2
VRQEIEAKYRLADHAPVRRLLEQAGAHPRGRVLEHNTFFDWPDGSLRAQDCGLRLRVAVPIDAANVPLAGAPAKVTLTYKGPRQEAEYKIRREIETAVEDAAAAAELLAALGLTATLSFQKRRETWPLGGCLVELDELPHLGGYVEIEGPADAIAPAACALGLADHPLEKRPYTTLLAELAGQKGLGTGFVFPLK